MPQTFRIVLRDAEGFEGLRSRRFDLSVGSTFPVGRASKNATKRDLMPAEHNAYIDSPVISRDHAVLSASTENDIPKVFIADCGSMHGTLVNGQRLTANVPKQLSSGDTIQFGIDVNRNEEFYVARKYTFEAELMPPQAPFSMGFTVPEPESEDEEITGTSPRRGSQNNPLTIDDSDSESDASDNEQAETTMIGEGFIVDEDDEPVAMGDFDLHHEAGGHSSEDEESLGDYPSDVDIHLDEGMDSQASIMGDSVVDYNSDMEISDVEAEDGSDTVGQQATSGSELPLQEQPIAPSLPAWATQHSSDSYNPMQSYVGSLPPMIMAQNNGMTSFAPPPPPPPPRPSATRPFFTRAEDQYSQRPSWFSDDGNTFSSFLGTNHGDRPSLFSPAPVPSMTPSQEAESAASTFDGNSTNFAPINSNRLQTPPAMPLPDVITTTPPPPGRRTKVSIGEIVEDQPPTPSSVNEMKRKADVLEEEDETPTPEEEAVAPAEEVVSVIEASTVDAPKAEAPTDVVAIQTAAIQAAATQTAAIIAQRPKKQPRSIMSKLRNTATILGYSAVGAAGALAMLTVLPDSFYT